jgi:hypothetical protein
LKGVCGVFYLIFFFPFLSISGELINEITNLGSRNVL